MDARWVIVSCDVHHDGDPRCALVSLTLKQPSHFPGPPWASQAGALRMLWSPVQGVAQAFPEVGRGPVTWPQRGGSPLAGGFGLAVRGRSPASPVMLEPTDAVPAVELVGEVGFHGGVIEPGLLTALRKDLRLGPGAAAARGTGAFPRSLGREPASGREGSTATKGQDVVTPGGLVRGQWRLLLPSAPPPRRSF